ncbi:hypothetical protein RJ639_033725, partial [Escallonia herrerae]
ETHTRRRRMTYAPAAQKPHAVCLPYPAQGHVNPMMKLAMLLHHRGFHITFVNTEYNHRRLLTSRGPTSLDGLPDFRFETIPDGLPPTEAADTTQDTASLFDSTRKNCLAPFREVLKKLNDDSSFDSPKVTCIISDAIMSFAFSAAQEIGIPSVGFRTSAACSFVCNLHCGRLVERGLIPLKDASSITSKYMDTTIDWLQGLTKSIRFRDFPTIIQTRDLEDPMFEFVMGETNRTSQASALIFNTFDALEHDALEAISAIYPRVFSIGPLHLLTNQLQKEGPLSSIGSSLWKEEPECLQWLNSKEPYSVIYVNFGSITIMSPQQLIEFAWGLANSKHNFLWIIRPDLVSGAAAVLPPEFVEATRGRSLVAGWCPQEEVLNHPSVGGFLTHCGWNSMSESLSSGVPMLCWPYFSDQPTNCRYACTDWGVGMEINGDVKRDEVEKKVRELMGGKKGEEMRNKAMEWKRKAEEAISLNGSSSLNLDKLVNEVLLTTP